MAINDWPEHERPRERLLQQGAAVLSDAELLAIFLRVGIRGKNAVELAHDLLSHFGSLTRLGNASVAEFSAIPGMGTAKYAQLQALLEIARRALKETLNQHDLLSTPQTVRDWLRLHLAHRESEVFVALWLDAKNRLIHSDDMFHGSLNQTSVYPRIVVKTALQRNAAAVIFAHNHPSGIAEPSRADEMLTRTLKTALELIDVRLFDHFIVAGNQPPVSFAERGLL